MPDPNLPPQDPLTRRIGHYLSNALIVGLIRFALFIPYRARLAFVGRFVQHILGPLAGYSRRARDNIQMIWPDLSRARRDQTGPGRARP